MNDMSTMTPELALKHIWMTAQCDPTALRSVSLAGTDPGLPSVYRVGTLASATIAATGLAAAEYHRLRTGRRQHVTVEMRRALASFRSERYLRIDDGAAAGSARSGDGLLRDADERWIQLHTNFPHHLAGVLKVSAARTIARRWPRRFAAGMAERLTKRSPTPACAPP
jgi:CoA-transferase family III.